MDKNTLKFEDDLAEQVSDATKMLAIAGLAVDRVEVAEDDARVLHVSTSDGTARACPGCGVFSTAHKGAVATAPKDIGYGHPVRLAWHKHRWRCNESRCAKGSFTESLPAIPAGSRCTMRLVDRMGEAVADQGRCVAEVATYFGTSWHTAHDAFMAWVESTLAAPLPEVKVLGFDEVRRGKAIWRKNLLTGKWEPTSQTCAVCGVKDGTKNLSIRAWECPSCGTFLDRDFNASVNILLAAGQVDRFWGSRPLFAEQKEGGDCGVDVRFRMAEATNAEAVTIPMPQGMGTLQTAA